MNDLPIVSIIIVGYNRLELLRQTIFSFLKNTTYPRNKLELILCDDGSPKEVEEEMRKLPFDKFLFAEKNQGIGANTNKGLKNAIGIYILQLQDDWYLEPGYEDYLLKGIEILSGIPSVGIVRFRLGVKYNTEILKTKKIHNIHILSRSQTNESLNNFLYSDNPHLKRKKFHDEFGFFIEGKRMELTELDMGLRFSNQTKYEAAVILGFENIFTHIGDDQSFRTTTFRYKLHLFMNSFLLNRLIIKNLMKLMKK